MRSGLRLLVASIIVIGSAAVSSYGGPAERPIHLEGTGKCWWPRLVVALSVASGTAAKDEDFTGAVEFLERNTQIESGLQITFVGYIVDKRQLRKALKRWIDWYIDHDPYLYWDPEQRRFAIDSDAQEKSEPTKLPREPADGNCAPAQPGTLKELFGAAPKD